MAVKKDKFSEALGNPALMFISTELAEEPKTAAEPQAEKEAESNGYVVRHKKIVNSEVKTKRVQLVFRPSTHKAATEKAAQLGLSLSEYIHALIEQDNTH